MPKLLEKTPRPEKKSLKVFYDRLHRWRRFLYHQWKSSTEANLSEELVGRSVDRLIGLVLLLEHCRRYGYFDLELSRFLDTWQDGTLAALQQRIVDSISCPILKKVFMPGDCDEISSPHSFLESRCEQRIRNSLWLLLRDHPVPLWLFGDYHQLCVANPPGKSGERKRSSQIRYARGIHYTPAPIVDYLTANVLGNSNSTDSPRVLDPSCGCGSFLIAAFRYLVEKRCLNESSLNREQAVLEVLGQSLFGVDVDSQAIDWTTRLLYLESKRLIGTKEEDTNSSMVPDISNNFLAKSFFEVDHRTFAGRINTILGGPPFVRYGELRKNQPEFVKRLRERFSSIKSGQFDLYMPFMEHAVNLLDDGNQIGFSLSNTFLHTGTGKGTCRFLLDRSTPLEVLEFSGGSVYPDAIVQIALLRLVVGDREQNQRRYVFLEPTKDIRVPLEQVFTSDSLPSNVGRMTPLDENELIPSLPTAARSHRHKIDGIRFRDLPVEFFCGATSKSDEVFMLKDHGAGAQGIRHGLTRRLKERVQCERELTVPIIRGREIKGFQYSPVKYFYIAPYIEGNLIPWGLLEKKHPLTFQYLSRFHESFVQNGGKEWYSYYAPPVYRQGEALVSCKIASLRSFTRMELSDRTIHGSAFGIAIKDKRIDSHLLLLYLNSKHFWEQVDATMPPLGIGRRAIRMSIFKDLRIPKRIAFPTEETVVEAQKLENRISKVVGRKKTKDVKLIFAELDSFIEKVH